MSPSNSFKAHEYQNEQQKGSLGRQIKWKQQKKVKIEIIARDEFSSSVSVHLSMYNWYMLQKLEN